MRLRDYQADILDQVSAATSHDLVQLDTGAGKTPIESALARDAQHCIVVAHRNLLIAQISAKLAAFGVQHGIIGTEHTRRCCLIEQRRHGAPLSLVTQAPTVWVASIDSVMARARRQRLTLDAALPWLIVIDEAHHVVKENKWGQLQKLFPHARFVGFTATPCRADGQSLHTDQGGLFERIVQADSLQADSVNKLVELGFLSPFKVWSIRSVIHDDRLRLGDHGDYTAPSLAAAMRGTPIVGDAVQHYRRLANGKRAVAMCVSILNAQETAEEFRVAGIASAEISSAMSAVEVARRIEAFRNWEILVLCNVDMVGEGFDLPGIEALIMLRKTASFVAYRQWIGRALRPLAGKPFAIIIDHVGNVMTHGLPDESVIWSLDGPPVGHSHCHQCPCAECRALFDAWRKTCPECGAENRLLQRTEIGGHYVNLEKIDQNLVEVARKTADNIRYAEALQTQIIIPFSINRWRIGGHAIESICRQLVNWMIATLKKDRSIIEINRFVSSQEAQSLEFWMKHFTVADLRNDNQKKAHKVFNKWQKSHSFTAIARR